MNPSSLIQNGTGFTWDKATKLSFCNQGTPVLNWSECGCAELHLGMTPITFPCEKHAERMADVFRSKTQGTFVVSVPQCRCTIWSLPQGQAITACQEHQEKLRAISAGG